MKLNYETPPKTISIPSVRLSWIHLALVIVVFLLFRQCSISDSLKSELSQIDKVKNDTIEHYETKLGEQGATRLSLQGEKASLQEFLSVSRDSTKQMERLAKKYKSIAAGVKTITETVIDSIEVPYRVDGKEFTIPFNKTDKFYSLAGRSTNNGLYLDNITIPNSQSIIIGEKKAGFFSSEFRVDVINSNPYIKTTSLDSYVYKQRNKRFVIGPSVGVGIGINGVVPQIGVHATYGIIRF